MAKILNDATGQLQQYNGDVDLMITLRLRAIDAENDAKIFREKADEVFLGLVNLLDIDTIDTDEGTYKWISKTGAEKLDKNKLKEYLLQKGFDSDTINDCFDAATTKGKDTKYTAFYPSKRTK